MVKYAKNRKQVTIYRHPKDEHWEAHTCVEQLKNGDVVVTFCEARGNRHEDFDTVMMIRSKDNGETWDPSTLVTVWPNSHHFGSDIPLVKQISDGTILVHHLVTSFHHRADDPRIGILEDLGPQSHGGFEGGIGKSAEGTWISRSFDNGYTWPESYKVNDAPLRWTMPADSILELPNGTLLMPLLGQLDTRRERKDEEPVRSVLLRSDNKGLDWEHWSTIAFDPARIITFDEPALGRNKDGVLVAMMRTEHQPRARLQNMWMAYSTNDGESWSRPEATNLWGYPADLVLLQDGRMLCTYGYRRPPWGVMGCISDDGLKWDVANEFMIREGGVAPISAHIGYPHSVQLKNGRILSVDHCFPEKPPWVQIVVGVLWDL